jgi:hypothetical protein
VAKNNAINSGPDSGKLDSTSLFRFEAEADFTVNDPLEEVGVVLFLSRFEEEPKEKLSRLFSEEEDVDICFIQIKKDNTFIA